ncbi:hypothetical protein OC835_004811 [Tilletia horrida]|nr:hypothetical protein OC835_004811 [Tilletia horrida]
MYRDRSSTRAPPQAQGHFDVGTDSPDSSPVEPRSSWVGAFERVMGDQAELLNSERRSRPTQPRPAPAVSQALEPQPSQSTATPYFNRAAKQQLAVSIEEPDGRRTGADKSSSYNVLILDFGDVLVGTSQERFIHLNNHSDIPCIWNARLEEGENMLALLPIEITDATTGDPAAVAAEGDEPPLPFSTLNPQEDKRLRIRMQPHEPCRDYEQTVSFTNLHNNLNSLRIVVRANMLGNAKNDALAVLSGDTLEFGDCFGGQWTQRTIVIKNLGDVVLEAAFSAQKGAEVVFQLPDLALAREDLDTDEFPSESGESLGVDDFYSGPGGSDAISMGESSRRSNSPMAAQHKVATGSSTGGPSAPVEMAETPRNPPQLFANAMPSELNLAQQADIKCAWARLQVPGSTSRGGTDDDSDMDAASLVSQGGSSRPSSPGMHASMYEPPNRFAHADYSPSSQGTGHSGQPGGHADATHLEANPAFRLRNRTVGAGPGSDGSIMSGYLASGHESDRGSAAGGSGMKAMHTAQGITRHWAAAHLGLRPSSSMTRASRAGRGEDGERHEDGTSSTSDMTALSQDSRIGPFPASSTYSTGMGSGSRYHRGGHSAVGSGLRPVEQPHSTQVEELFLRPGTEYRVIVSYRPPRADADEDFSAGQLQSTTFSISIDYARARVGAKSRGGRERKTVTCHLRTCTSFITVEPKFIDFGEVNVGSRKRAMVTVTNRSDLTTRIDTRVVSKVISMFADEVLVTPQRPYELELQFFPRRVNDKYRKQITIANLFNRTNDQIVEVRAQNVDSEGISLHSMFYSILTPTGANFLDFGDVNINSTRIRTFSVVNISSSKIALELNSPTPEDLALYIKPEPKLASKSGDAVAESGAGGASPEPFKSPVPTAEGSKSSQVRRTDRADLKERFLEALATDSTLPARRENKTWRQAQKRAQQGRQGAAAQHANGDGSSSKPKPTINLFAALKKGGKGRLTVQYGKSIAFKDRTLLRDFEYLDLATGLPVDARRLPAKSKRLHNLDSIEGGTSLRSRGSIRAKRGDVSKNAKDTKTLAQKLIERNDPQHTDDGSSQASLDANGESRRQPALTGKRKAPDALADPTDLSKLSIHELIAAVERQPDKLSSFYLNNPQAEERHVRMEINLHKELQKAIANERLQPIHLLQLEPGAEQQVVVVMCPNGSTRPHIAGNARKQDLRINFRLVEYDATVLRDTTFGQQAETDDALPLPTRELMVRTTLCRSIMELGQAHINLGFMEKGETKARKILIQNRSEWALRYCIKKSGSIVSGDIKLGAGRYGVVPGHGKREVEFVFTPSYIGQLQEKLVIEDVADHDNDQTIQLKAQVRKLPNFSVEPNALDLGSLLVDETSASHSFSITNVTSKARKFVVNIDEVDLRLPALTPSGEEITFDVAVATASEAPKAILTQAEEEEVEHISQKLKVAHRKGQTDKVQKYEERLAQLGVPIPKMSKAEQGSEQSEPMSAVSTTMEPAAEVSSKAGGAESSMSPADASSSSRLQKQGATVTFSLDANESLRIILHVRILARRPTRLVELQPDSEMAARLPTEATPPALSSAITTTTPVLAGLSPPSDERPTPDSEAAVPPEAAQLPFSIPIYLHENKNKDETSTVSVGGIVLLQADRARRDANLQPFARRPGVVVFSGSK